MSESNILTGQFVRIDQAPASAGERILARSIDIILLIIYILATVTFLDSVKGSISNTNTLLLFVLYLPVLCYSLLCEVFNQGQSAGKCILGIRVVKVDGTTPTVSSYLLRWLLFLIDAPLTGGLGLLVILLTKNKQRIGDLAAGTMVIKEQNYKKIQVSLDEFNYLREDYHPTYLQAADLSLEQINVIAKALDSKNRNKESHIALLASKLRSMLSINTTIKNDEHFLQTIMRDYQYYAMEDNALI
ncbi:RDD family protein [Bacteroides ihuae]|uniref:RDD family protein n=1 Tax=Bacteroides ihuae TaxID=1852362 RepID=UPI0008DA8DC4|nr:RDD family protein [Bacteroides ihuae]